MMDTSLIGLKVVVVLLLFAPTIEAVPQPCASFDQTFNLSSALSQFDITGLLVRAASKSPTTGQLNNFFSGSFLFEGLIEVASPQSLVTSEYVCPSKSSIPQYIDGLSFANPDVWNSYGTGTNNLTVQGLNLTQIGWCEMQQRRRELAPNIYVNEVITLVTIPEFPDFSFNMTAGMLDGADTFTFQTFGASDRTLGWNITYAYKKNKLKLTFEFENFPWKIGSDPRFVGQTESTMTMFMTLIPSAEYLTGSVGLSWFFAPISFDLSLRSGGYEILASFEKHFVVDGEAVVTSGNYKVNPPSFTPVQRADTPGFLDAELATGLLTTLGKFSFYVPVCADEVGLGDTHWTYLSYDPTLSILFTGDASSPSNKKSIIGPIVGSLLGLLLIIGVFLVIYFKSPAVRTFFRPFLRRKAKDGLERDYTKAPKESSSWAQGVKPTKEN